jgi:hypothetical protein
MAGREKTSKIKPTTVLFVPSTKGGILTKMLRENEEEMVRITQFRTKIQEAGGIKLAGLFSTNLSRGAHCQREDCQPCNAGEEKRQNCKLSNILYESKCELCNATEEDGKTSQVVENREGIYIGETSRSLYERSREHVRDATDFKEGSHIIKHWLSNHPETLKRPQFKFTIIRNFKDCLSRQVAEAIRIHYSNDTLLNSKNEYNANCLTRLVVEESLIERKKREQREERKELEERRGIEELRLRCKRGEKRETEDNNIFQRVAKRRNKSLIV